MAIHESLTKDGAQETFLSGIRKRVLWSSPGSLWFHTLRSREIEPVCLKKNLEMQPSTSLEGIQLAPKSDRTPRFLRT